MREQYNKKLAPIARELRHDQTPAERKLWFEFLRTHPAKFRRQVPLQRFILDFYAPSLNLCLELDGSTHDTPEAQAHDSERTAYLNATGIQVLRFQNREVMNHFSDVCAVIDATCQERANQSTPLTGSLLRGAVSEAG